MNRSERRRQQKWAAKAAPNGKPQQSARPDGQAAPRSDDTIRSLIAIYRAESLEPQNSEQVELGKIHLEPHLDAIVHDLYALRAQTDAHFLALQDAIKRGETPIQADLSWKILKYPVSCCLEIVCHMMELMAQPSVSPDATGLIALRDFQRAGGTFKRVWGALRGKYFQNAIQVGNHYLDVANDTVDPRKDKIEILPLPQSGFRNIASYHEYAQVAEAYWGCRMVPNVFFPNLAPFLPIVTFFENGAVRLDSFNNCMFPMNLESNFQLAHDYVFNTACPNDELESRRALLARLLANRTNPGADHLLHFSAVPDDKKLKDFFAACAGAEPTALSPILKDVLRIQPDIGQVDIGTLP